MASRGRGSRAETAPSAPAQADVRRSTRNTRQTITTVASGPAREVRAENHAQDQPERFVISKLATAEPARRGAPRAPGSIVSIATQPLRADSDVDNSDDGRTAEIPDSVVGSPPKQTQARPVSDEIAVSQSQDTEAAAGDVRQQIMALSLPDLLKASQDLMELLKSERSNNPVLLGRVKIRRIAFAGVREIYEDHDPLFLHVDDTAKQISSAGTSLETSLVLEHANLTTALDLAERIRAEEDSSVLEFFETLDHFQLFFPHGASNIQGSESLHLTLRTNFLIEALARASKANVYNVVGTIFCESAKDREWTSLLEDGPYRSLADLSESDSHHLCKTRVEEIVSIIERNKKDFGVRQLRARFPLVDLLDDFRRWVLTAYATLEAQFHEGTKSTVQQIEQGPLLGDEEEFADSVTGSDSQPIVRLTESQDLPSLYQGPESRRFLDEQARKMRQPPPSNQQQQRPPPGAPRDYPEHSNEQLLSQLPLPPVSSGLLPEQSASSALNRSSKRKHFSPFHENDEEDDPFETDTRTFNPPRKPIPSSSLPEPKRQRVVHTSNGSAAADRNTMPPPPVPSRSQAPAPEPSMRSTLSSSQPFPASSSTRADFDAIKARKLVLSQETRRFSERPSQIKQRQPWDAEDCETLINLIHERQAAWATIEQYDGNKFHHPRNQQAYRDKARNMKVDFLLLDVVLPPGFNLVALGKKEIDRVKGLGKNPYRREEDLDEDGEPINTEYIEHLHNLDKS